MKKIYFLLVLLPLFVNGQVVRLGTYIPVDIPMKHEMPKAGVAGGLGMNIAVQPVARIPIAFELKGNIGRYSDKTLEQTYLFSDGSQTVTDVNYTSNFHKVLIGTRFSTGNQASAFRVHATPQIGYGFMNSRIRISDPQDVDDCKPLEKRITQRFNGAVYGGEIGLDMQFGKLFGSTSTDRHNRFIFSVNFLRSFNNFEYVNIRYMQDEPHGVALDGHPITDEERDINATFVNVSSNNLHEHKIAELYKTPLSFIGFQIGYVYNF
jgi:hypothetical protein|tara:strand:- start:28266 stop:29060 length:795 start_codon:yes stop_codon:yes gene_type:complete